MKNTEKVALLEKYLNPSPKPSRGEAILANVIERCRWAATRNNPGAKITLNNASTDLSIGPGGLKSESRNILADGRRIYTVYYDGTNVRVYNAANRQAIPGAVALPVHAAIRFIGLYWKQQPETIH